MDNSMDSFESVIKQPTAHVPQVSILWLPSLVYNIHYSAHIDYFYGPTLNTSHYEHSVHCPSELTYIFKSIVARLSFSLKGDSGGPMVTKQGAIWIQAGITSWGLGCAQPGLPGVYTMVSRYQTWISNIIKTNLPGFVMFPSVGQSKVRHIDKDTGTLCSNDCF